MESKDINQKGGSSYSIPAFFPNPQTGPEGELVRDLISSHNLETVSGITVNLEDMSHVKDNLQLTTARLNATDSGMDMQKLAFMIIPDVSSLFGVLTNRDPDHIFDLGVLPNQIEEFWDLAEEESGDISRHMKMIGLYPLLGSQQCLLDLFEYQIEQGADFVSPPTVPLNSKIDFEHQLTGQRHIFSKSKEIVEGADLSQDKDLLHVISLDPTVFDAQYPDRIDDIVEIIVENEPDTVAFRLTDLSDDSTARHSNQTLLNVLNKVDLAVDAPLFVLNVREFGLVTFLYGADAISSPIAASPYPRISTTRPPARGNYYHKEKMDDYSRDALMALRSVRRNNYLFPCDCPSCSNRTHMHQLDADEWNDNRKRHFIFTKESEVRQLRDTNNTLKEALRDKFGRSERTEYLKYIN